MKKYIKKSTAILIAVLFLLTFSGCSLVSDKAKATTEATEATTTTEATTEATTEDNSTEPFTLTMLDVGQGLSVLIQSGDHSMLYDGGGRDYSSYVVRYLKEHDITTLDYMIASHYDDDHINGLVGVLNTTEVNQVFTPDYETDTEIYDSFENKLEQNGAPDEHPSVGDEYTFGDATFQILSPASIDTESDNNNSLVIRITNGTFSAIITGDAEFAAEEAMVNSDYDLDSDVYVVGHHGSSSSSSPSFVEAVAPKYALISVGADNSYGHPTKDTLETLQNADATIFRTDLNGEITITSDGDNYEITSEQDASDEEELTPITRSNTTEADSESSESSDSSADSTDASYVLNENTHKFHLPGCKSVKQMNEANRVYTNQTREELIDEGYDPCQNCNP